MCIDKVSLAVANNIDMAPHISRSSARKAEINASVGSQWEPHVVCCHCMSVLRPSLKWKILLESPGVAYFSINFHLNESACTVATNNVDIHQNLFGGLRDGGWDLKSLRCRSSRIDVSYTC